MMEYRIAIRITWSRVENGHVSGTAPNSGGAPQLG